MSEYNLVVISWAVSS